MAELDAAALKWLEDELPSGTKLDPGADPGVRVVSLPPPLPELGDDFDWGQRDFEGFRDAMWRELRDRFPERKRWSTGDIEAVFVEVLAALLDQLSDYADRVHAEAYLLTARRIESVLAWLDFIAYRPERERGLSTADLLDLYRRSPHELELDRSRGPRSIRRQRRMVSRSDHGLRLEDHPLVLRAFGRYRWTGSWFELTAVVSLYRDLRLDERLFLEAEQHTGSWAGETPALRCIVPENLQRDIERFHESNGLRPPQWNARPSARLLLADYLTGFRMVGQVVELADIVPVGIEITLLVSLRPNYFHSEVRRELERVLGDGPTGFFRPGRLAAGQDLHIGDIYGAVMPLDGVAKVEVLRFARPSSEANASASATDEVPDAIILARDELAICRSGGPGALVIRLAGGRPG